MKDMTEQLKSILGMMNLSPEDAVRRICKERGIDVDAFLQECEKKQREMKGR